MKTRADLEEHLNAVYAAYQRGEVTRKEYHEAVEEFYNAPATGWEPKDPYALDGTHEDEGSGGDGF